MKIVHIIPALNAGGAEKFCIDLCNEQAKTNNVVLVSLHKIQASMFLADNIDNTVRVEQLNKKMGFDIFVILKLFYFLKKENPDIVNTHLIALLYSAIPLILLKILSFHTIHNDASKENISIVRRIYKYCFQKCAVNPIGISKTISDSIYDEYKIIPDIIENGVSIPHLSKNLNIVNNEIALLKNDTNTRVFINIARIAEQKNQITLIRIFNKLYAQKKNVILLIIGEEYNSTKEITKKLHNEKAPNTHLLGAKKNIGDYLILSDAFCLSSNYEGLPITLLEAMSFGIIPICTPVGGVNDVVSKTNGFLSDDTSEESYFRAIISYLESNEEKIKQMRLRAKELFNLKYDIKLSATKYLKLYSKYQNKC